MKSKFEMSNMKGITNMSDDESNLLELFKETAETETVEAEPKNAEVVENTTPRGRTGHGNLYDSGLDAVSSVQSLRTDALQLGADCRST